MVATCACVGCGILAFSFAKKHLGERARLVA